MKKLIGKIFIILAVIGSFTSAPTADAQASPYCRLPDGTRGSQTSQAECNSVNGQWIATTVTPVAGANSTDKSAFERAIKDKNCGVIIWGSLEGCLITLTYWIFFAIPAGIMTLVASLFNSLLALSIGTQLYRGGFIEGAWTVVRDLSNMFFIFILLYAAIRMILGLGGHDSKKMIVWVIIMALLINFSMFFTKVVIDSSNILAVTLYNRILVSPQLQSTYTPGVTAGFTEVAEKNISGSIIGAFNITRTMSDRLLDMPISVFGGNVETVRNSTSLMILITIVAGAIMLFAAYAFFVAAFSFLGRLVELWILIIFSPFAFMSYAVPKLSGIEGIGWSKWSSRLVEVAFMAPIFMFFMYLIARMSSVSFLPTPNDQTMQFIPFMLMIIIPSMIFIILLMKATDYAKKGSGQLGAAMVGLGKAALVAAGGGAMMTGAMVGRNTLGQTAKFIQNNEKRDKALTFKDTQDQWSKGGWSRLGVVKPAVKDIAKFAPAGIATILNGGRKLNAAGVSQSGGINTFLQKSDKGVEDKKHSEHVVAAKISEMHEDLNLEDKNTKFKDLTDEQKNKVRKAINMDMLAKIFFKKKFKGVTNTQDIQALEDALAAGPNASGEYTANIFKRDPITGLITQQPVTARPEDHDAAHHESNMDADQTIGTFVQALRKGTYDLRNLADLSTAGQPMSVKIGVGIPALAASIIRTELKMATGVDKFGTPQKDSFKDLRNTITDSLKNVKIDASSFVGSGGGDHGGDEHAQTNKGGDSHGGGGGHH